MKLKTTVIIVSLAISLSLSACTNGKNVTQGAAPEQNESESIIDQSKFAWSIVIEHAERDTDLSTSEAVAQYSGDVKTIQHYQSPATGKAFLLLKLDINKQIAGKSTYMWSDSYVLDSLGNKIPRMENDVFLEDYGFKRIKAVDLTMGNNEGFACYEVPIEATQFWFVHVTDEGENKQIINIK